MSESLFPPGTSVRVKSAVGASRLHGPPVEAQVEGVVEAWEEQPTGSWHAHGRKDKLWLRRLKLRKANGEVTLLIIDDATEITALKPKTTDE